MPKKRIHLSISPTQYKELLKLAEKLGMDLTNVIRYCIACTLNADFQHEREHKNAQK